MRYTNRFNLIFVQLILLVITGCSIKTYPSAEVTYLSSNGGTVSLTAVGVGTTIENANANAEKNAFDVLFFRGLPGSEQKTPLIGENEIEEIQKNKTYFNTFYLGKRYKSFITSYYPVTNLIKRKGTEKYITINLSININSLRTDLEQNNVIRKFGF